MDDAQADAEEVRHKEDTAKKFDYASITFNTFKPSQRQPPSRPPSYQPELDNEQRRNRLPSFARNYNPAANRLKLARSYEVVTLIHKSAGEDSKAGASACPVGNEPMEEYETLKYPERRPSLAPQRNLSISQEQYIQDYSQLPVKKKPTQKMRVFEEPLGHSQNERPVPKRRINAPSKALMSSYSSVKKCSPPPLPPPYNPTFDGMAGDEGHYKVPKSYRNVANNHYDCPSSVVRLAWSCENLNHSAHHAATGHEAAAATSIYDMPSSISPPLPRRFEREAATERSLQSLISQDSYVDMS